MQQIQPLVESNTVNKEQAKQSASSQSENEIPEDSGHPKQFHLRRGDTNESILQTISQSVMIDTGLSATSSKSRAQRRATNPSKPEVELQKRSVPGFDIKDEELSQQSQSCTDDDDDFDNAPMEASQILQSSGIFRRPAMIPSLRGHRTS